MGEFQEEKETKEATEKQKGPEEEKPETEKKGFKVSDKRFWFKKEQDERTEGALEPERYPTYVEELKAQKEESEKKLMEYIQAFKKMQTEQEEFRVRWKKDIDKKVLAGKRDIFLKLLEMLDNLDRAIQSAKNSNDSSSLLHGIIISRDHFLSILKREGVERMEVVGKPFHPEFAEAMMVEEVGDPLKNNLILEEIQPGYTFHEQTLRAAKVKVARASAANEKSSQV